MSDSLVYQAREWLAQAVQARKRAEKQAQEHPWSQQRKQQLIMTQKQEWFWNRRVAELEGQQVLAL